MNPMLLVTAVFSAWFVLAIMMAAAVHTARRVVYVRSLRRWIGEAASDSRRVRWETPE